MFTLLLVQHSTLGFDSLHSLINHLTVALIFSSSFLAWQNLVSHSTCKQNIRGHKCQFISCFLASTRTKERKKRCERRKGNEERRNIGSHHDNFECVDENESLLKWDVEFHGLLLRWNTEFQGKRISCDVNEQLDFNPSISISHHHLVHLPEIRHSLGFDRLHFPLQSSHSRFNFLFIFLGVAKIASTRTRQRK